MSLSVSSQPDSLDVKDTFIACKKTDQITLTGHDKDYNWFEGGGGGVTVMLVCMFTCLQLLKSWSLSAY